MPVGETISGVFLKELSKQTAGKILHSFRSFKPDVKAIQLEEGISDHLRFVAEWTKTVSFYELVDGKMLEEVTIPLNFSTPRLLTNPKLTNIISEIDILQNNNKYLILGDPGGGKSTTMARLARHVLQDSPKTSGDNSAFPIVVRLRDVEDSLILHLLECFGQDIGASKLIRSTNIKQVAKIVRESQAMLILDGLDEVPKNIREKVESEISDLSMFIPDTKVLLSCRSGSYKTVFENYSIVEIKPLSGQQINIIANKWLGANKANLFLNELHKQKYADSANRPLFLSQLMIVYDKSNCLPYRPYEVPEQLIRLIVVDWDQKNKRRVQRMSDYAGFNTTQKLKFLSALSYELTYEIGLKQFTTPTLVRAYQKICDSFDLPPIQAKDVATEIESHTGLIIQSHGGTYDFCHMSLQEHLCAEYLSRIPMTSRLPEYIEVFPGVLALACVLSTNSSDWMIALCLKDENWETFVENPKRFYDFIGRLAIERPSFGEDIFLGFAMIVVINEFWNLCGDEIYQLFEAENRGLIRSIVKALNHYSAKHKPDDNGFQIMFVGKEKFDYNDYSIPKVATIPEEFVSILSEQSLLWPEDNQVIYTMSRLL